MSDKAIKSTTQEFLDVYDIVNDMVLLKDGTAAVILRVGTMNFSLLAEQEQDAVIFTYGSLLNSLNYPIQINIQSQTKDATKYLRLLDDQISKASSDRKATLIKQYRDFVAALIKERNVLQKSFYIIVPASPGEMGLITPSSVLPGKNAFDINSVEKNILIEKAVNLLEPRTDHLTSQFNRLGLYVRQLSTQEIIQNFYINYNPEAIEGQEISSSENYTTPLVRASFGGKFMQSDINQNNSIQNQSTVIQPQNPTPEEILSKDPTKTTDFNPNVVANNSSQFADQQTLEQTPTLEQAPVLEQAVQENIYSANSEQSNTMNMATPTGEIQTEKTIIVDQPNQQDQSSEINLTLDPKLVNTGNNSVEFQNQSFVNPILQPVPEPVQQPVPEPVFEPAQNSPAEAFQASPDSFVEEIVPLQNKLETQISNSNQS